MKQDPERIKNLISHLKSRVNFRSLVITLSAIVVFVTTYLLILPAITLDKEQAIRQGGVDVAVEQTIDDTDEQNVNDTAEQTDEGSAGQPVNDAAEDTADVKEPDDVKDTPDPEPSGQDKDVKDVKTEENTPDRDEVELLTKTKKLTADNDESAGFTVSAVVDKADKVPADVTLQATELTKDTEGFDYDRYYKEVLEALKKDDSSVKTIDKIRFYDISLESDSVDGSIEPDDKVSVRIKYDKENKLSGTDNVRVVHFESENKTEILDSSVSDNTVEFESESFSVYAIVDLPDGSISSLDIISDTSETGSQGFQMTVKVGKTGPTDTNNYYLNGETVSNVSGNSDRYGLDAPKYTSESIPSDAETFYFERIGDTNQFYIYKKEGGVKKYLQMTTVSANVHRSGLQFAEDASQKTAFTLQQIAGGRFHISGTVGSKTFYWVRNTRSPGVGAIVGFDADDDVNTAWVGLHQEGAFDDPYGLDGNTYSLLVWDGGKTAKAMMSEANTGTGTDNLAAKLLTVMTKTGDEDDKLYVPGDTSDKATSWTFHNVENDLYTLSADTGQYLKISSDGLTLVDSAADAGRIQVVPGTGIHSGQIILKDPDTGATLTYSGKYAEGFDVNAGIGKEYLYLAEEKPESMLDGYYKTYSATKVSVSDLEKVSNEQRIVVYTRAWNESRSKYDYFALDGEGNLVPCSESGDKIEWVGPTLNEMQWIFTEHYYEGTTTPNNYYDLQNEYTGKWLAPLMEGKDGRPAQILADEKIGLNLPGRRNGQYYTPFLVWDEDNYAYASVKVDLDATDPVIEPCIRSEGLDFYFAIIDETDPDDNMHTVPTVDNDMYGITMKLKDFGSRPEMSNFLGNNEGGLTTKLVQGLLSTNLGDDGYPTAAGGSLGTFFSGAETVNHLFIESTYQATGYYEYDSAQNFATLQGRTSGDFVVYEELGSYDSGGDKYTLKHGQFFPYNDLTPGHFASVNGRNLYTPTGEELAADNPRRNEQLYLIDDVDCYFGAELEASFVQTPNGLDAWGHDIVFEFSGDDDFWLYVDGELIIDLGGIHSAVPGSVNFKTGNVHVNGKDYTLRQLIESNYRARNPNASDDDVNTYLRKFFDDGKTVFRDNTDHTMKIFYLERGGGASNLNMRFNLASVKKGTVQLSKDLDGIDDTESAYASFPYQIWYKDPTSASGEYVQLTPASGTGVSVKYLDSTNDVEYARDLVVKHVKDDSIYEVTYKDVYFLEPGETAVITFPDFGEDENGKKRYVEEYKIIECGVDPEVYPNVSSNDTLITGTVACASAKTDADGTRTEYTEPYTVDSGLKDYSIEYSLLNSDPDYNPKVKYVNKVEETGILTIQKELYAKETNSGSEVPRKIVLYNDDGTLAEGVSPDNPDLHTKFAFRLYFKNTYDEDYSLAIYHKYHVKDPAGRYCKWDVQSGEFVLITNDDHPDGITEFSDLSDNTYDEYGHILAYGEKHDATFETSMNGSIDSIPAYYTVEVRNVIPGTAFKVVERPTEIPDGYQFWQYALDGEALEDVTDPEDGVSDRISAKDESDVLVRNFKGYGLRLKKNWADAATMEDRDSAWFAVFYEVKDSGGNIISREMVEDSARELKYEDDPQELYWAYLDLPLPNTAFDNYCVYEVERKTDSTGGYTYVPVLEGGIVSLNGTHSGGTASEPINYMVSYEEPELIGDNVKEFKAANAPSDRPAVSFLKKDWDGSDLEGAAFTLTNGQGENIFSDQPGNGVSDSAGLIAQKYLTEDAEYVLSETSAPKGYYGIEEDLTIKLVATPEGGWTLDVTPATGDITDYYDVETIETVDPDTGLSTESVELTIKDRPYDFEAIKVDGTNKLAGAVFNLYRPKTVIPYTNWEIMTFDGSSDLVTDSNGVIPHLDRDLPSGTYQLREITAPEGYKLVETIEFTISPKGKITLKENSPAGASLTSEIKDGRLVYTLTISDRPQPLKLKKVDGSGQDLPGAKFTLQKHNGSTWENYDLPGTQSNVIDMTTAAVFDMNDLPDGFYHLTETNAPPDYVITDDSIYFRIKVEKDTSGKSKRIVVLTDESGEGQSTNTKAALNGPDQSGIYTIVVTNTQGEPLPVTGGIGTTVFYIIGSILVLVCGIVLAARRRVRVHK